MYRASMRAECTFPRWYTRTNRNKSCGDDDADEEPRGKRTDGSVEAVAGKTAEQCTARCGDCGHDAGGGARDVRDG